MKYTVIIPRCGGGAAYEGDPAVGCVREDVEILNGHGTNPGNARNDALNRASGEWIVFCDADDRLLPEVLPLLDRMTSEHPTADMVKYAWRRNGASVPIRAFRQYAYRRSSLGGIRFPDLCMGEDLLYLEHCLRHASEIAETDEFGYEQIVNDRSLTRRRPTRQGVSPVRPASPAQTRTQHCPSGHAPHRQTMPLEHFKREINRIVIPECADDLRTIAVFYANLPHERIAGDGHAD